MMVRETRQFQRSRFDATVAFNRPICREHFLLRMRVKRTADGKPFPPTQPGQFIQLGCRPPDGAIDADELCGRELEWQAGQFPGKLPGVIPGALPGVTQPELCAPLAMLRRPFSLSGRGEDETTGETWLEIVHRVVGVGTRWLAQLNTGDAVDLIGPLGNAFDLPGEKSLGLLVGGGVGLPPMFYLAQALAQAKWDAIGFVGALGSDLLAITPTDVAADAGGTPTKCALEFARHNFPTVVTTDDGSRGLHGRITAGLEIILQAQSPYDAKRTVVYTCGPEPMMHAVAKLAHRHGVDCQVCLEQAMACGMGTCQSCVVKISPEKFSPGKPEPAHGVDAAGHPWRFKLACTDGPVFAADAVVW